MWRARAFALGESKHLSRISLKVNTKQSERGEIRAKIFGAKKSETNPNERTKTSALANIESLIVFVSFEFVVVVVASSFFVAAIRLFVRVRLEST